MPKYIGYRPTTTASSVTNSLGNVDTKYNSGIWSIRDIYSKRSKGSWPTTSRDHRDPLWANVVLSAPFTSSLADLSNSAHTLTAVGDAAIDSGSLLLDGTGDRVTSPDNVDWYLPGDFTIECDVNLNGAMATNTARIVCGQREGSSGGARGWIVYTLDLAGTTYMTCGDDSFVNQPATFTPGTFQRLAWVRSSNTLYFFVDGTMQGSGSAFSDTITDRNLPMIIGANGDFTSPMNGRLKHLRVTKGVARYTSSYTADFDPYPTS